MSTKVQAIRETTHQIEGTKRSNANDYKFPVPTSKKTEPNLLSTPYLMVTLPQLFFYGHRAQEIFRVS